ncbi:MFS transporter [Enemella evansiae]|nr:MFS transporter [Enemella evansiae]
MRPFSADHHPAGRPQAGGAGTSMGTVFLAPVIGVRVGVMSRVLSVWPLYAAAFLATFQLSLANISVPDIRHSLGTGPAGLSLVVGAFTAAFAAGLVTAGHLGDRLGRRRLFRIGLAGVVLATVAAAVAPGIGLLLVARAAQGLASAVMMPQILATIQAMLTGADRALAVAVFSAASGVGTVAGQLVGGAVIVALPAGFGWRGALLTGAVVAAAAYLGGAKLPDTRSAHPARIDPVGSMLLAAALLVLVVALSLGPTAGWAVWDLGLLGLAVVLLIALILHQRWAARTDRPAVLPAAVLALPPVWIGMTMALVFFSGFGAFMYDFALFTQGSLGLNAFGSGLATGLFALAFVTGSITSTRMIARFGGRTMVIGAVLQGLSLIAVGLVSWAQVSGWVWWFQLIGVVLGFAQSWMFAPLVGAVMQAVPDRVAGLTGGLIATAQQAALGLGVAVFGGLYAQLGPVLGESRAFGAVAFIQVGLAVVFGALAVRLLGAQNRVVAATIIE